MKVSNSAALFFFDINAPQIKKKHVTPEGHCKDQTCDNVNKGHLYSICNFCFSYLEPRVRYYFFEKRNTLLNFVDNICEVNWLTGYQRNIILSCDKNVLCQQCFMWYQRFSEVQTQQADRKKKIISPIYSVLEFIRSGGESRQPDRRCIRAVLKRIFKKYSCNNVELKNALLQTPHGNGALNYLAEAYWGGSLRITSKKSFILSCLAHFWVRLFKFIVYKCSRTNTFL